MTSMDSTVELSDDFLIRMFPLSTSTASEKVRTMLLSMATSVALSAGVELPRDGEITSAVVKEREVVSEIPAKELLEGSSKAVAGIWR